MTAILTHVKSYDNFYLKRNVNLFVVQQARPSNTTASELCCVHNSAKSELAQDTTGTPRTCLQFYAVRVRIQTD